MARGQEGDGAYRPLAVYTEVLAKIKSDYVEEPNMEKVTNGALQGLVEFLDPQSSYLTPEQFEKVTEHLDYPDRGSGLSTGLVVRKRSGYATVLHVLPGSAGDRAGIRPFDLIEAIDGLSTQLMPPAYLRAMLSGPPESSVTVLVRSLRRSEEPQEHTLVRGPLEAPAVEHKMLEGDVGYLALDRRLDNESVERLAGAVKRLESQGAGKLVLDLRGNAVGETEKGVRLADLFLDSGLIASLKGQQYPEKKFHAGPGSSITSLPLVVITDRATAGAAELAAAAILDNKRGEVVGERTYGLAAVQETITMEDGAALILSVAKYRRPNGEALQDGGLTPSFPLPPATVRRYRMSRFPGADGMSIPPEIPDEAESGQEDPYLKKALEVLTGDEAAKETAA